MTEGRDLRLLRIVQAFICLTLIFFAIAEFIVSGRPSKQDQNLFTLFAFVPLFGIFFQIENAKKIILLSAWVAVVLSYVNYMTYTEILVGGNRGAFWGSLFVIGALYCSLPICGLLEFIENLDRNKIRKKSNDA